jgi:hypothetical protein
MLWFACVHFALFLSPGGITIFFIIVIIRFPFISHIGASLDDQVPDHTMNSELI